MFAHKFGKLPPKRHPKTLRLSKYLDAGTLPPPEIVRGWEIQSGITDFGMLGNDSVGDCVIAAMLHYLMMAKAIEGSPVTYTTEQALALYSAITGYDPNDPSTDQGTVWTDALAYWQNTGVYGDKILGWAQVDYTDPVKLNQAIDIFGAALIGTAVTQSMEDQFGKGEPWNAPFSGEVLGGHGIPLTGFGREGRTLITWGKAQPSDLTMPTAVFDEAYVVITPSWLAKAEETPLGIDLEALQADLAAIKES